MVGISASTLVFFWPVLFGLAPLMEYLQGVLRPLRVYSMEDSYANLAGVALGLFVVSFYRLICKLFSTSV